MHCQVRKGKYKITFFHSNIFFKNVCASIKTLKNIIFQIVTLLLVRNGSSVEDENFNRPHSSVLLTLVQCTSITESKCIDKSI